MTMYCQDIFDHPVCILKSRPTLIRHYYADDHVMSRNTGCSLVVYLQPKDNIEKATTGILLIFILKKVGLLCKMFELSFDYVRAKR